MEAARGDSSTSASGSGSASGPSATSRLGDGPSKSPQSTSPEELARGLGELDQPARLAAVARLTRRQMAALFELGQDRPPLTLAEMVPAELPPLVEVIHEGKNSLPAFTRFQKRFCRPPTGALGAQTELWGYNEQAMRAVTGPGYFVAHHDERGELVIDYFRLPPAKPDAWPKILPNSARLGRFVYANMIDVVRRVAPGVVVGRAYKNGRAMDVWFALARRSTTGGAA